MTRIISLALTTLALTASAAADPGEAVRAPEDYYPLADGPRELRYARTNRWKATYLPGTPEKEAKAEVVVSFTPTRIKGRVAVRKVQTNAGVEARSELLRVGAGGLEWLDDEGESVARLAFPLETGTWIELRRETGEIFGKAVTGVTSCRFERLEAFERGGHEYRDLLLVTERLEVNGALKMTTTEWRVRGLGLVASVSRLESEMGHTVTLELKGEAPVVPRAEEYFPLSDGPRELRYVMRLNEAPPVSYTVRYEAIERDGAPATRVTTVTPGHPDEVAHYRFSKGALQGLDAAGAWKTSLSFPLRVGPVSPAGPLLFGPAKGELAPSYRVGRLAELEVGGRRYTDLLVFESEVTRESVTARWRYVLARGVGVVKGEASVTGILPLTTTFELAADPEAPRAAYCPSCGRAFEAGDNFCGSCGKRR